MEYIIGFFMPGRIKSRIYGLLGKYWYPKFGNILQGVVNQPLCFASALDIFKAEDSGLKELIADDGLVLL